MTINTGFNELDKLIHGINEKELILIGGKQNIDISTFTIDIINYIPTQNTKKILYFNLKNSTNELIKNIHNDNTTIINEFLKINEIIDKVREEINNINLVVIDYLYLAIEKDDNDIKECLRKLKVLSRILNIPIIVLHELEENIDKLLILNECDIVLFMNKINDTNNYEIVVEKNCYGPLGTIKLKLDDKLMTFKGI